MKTCTYCGSRGIANCHKAQIDAAKGGVYVNGALVAIRNLPVTGPLKYVVSEPHKGSPFIGTHGHIADQGGWALGYDPELALGDWWGE